MSFDDQVDLGIKDNSGEKDDGFEKFLSKPIQRQYQPFGGPKPQTQSSIAQPQYAPQEPQPQPQPQPYHNFNDYDLDGYEQAKKQHSQISQFTRENKKSASHYSGLYDDFKKNEFTPYFESIGGFGDFETDEEYISAIDEMYKSDLKNSQAEDGWFGASESKLSSAENLKKYGTWNQPNGLRDKFQRLKRERDTRKSVADQAEAQEFALFEQMTSIPIAQREALDASLKARTAKPKSRKATDEMLNQMQFEDPVVDMVTGEVTNLEKTDPRNSPPSAVNMVTGERTPAVGKQAKRLEAAMRGDMAGFMTRRESIAKDRQIRDKGFMFSSGGQIDGRPIGMSRKDTDLLDLEEMQKAGMTEYKGQPIEQALEQLGGGERLKVAKVMQSVYAAKSTYEDAQLEFLKVSGGAKGEAARDKMEAAREEVNKTIGLAAQHGLDNELFEQAETTGWLAAIGNSVKRGLLMSEMSNYTPDFLTNTLDADEMQRFIEIASEIEELPTSSTMKRVKSTKSDGFLDAMGNLLFDNPAAIPEMFVESLSSFLPSAIKWVIPSAATGALAGSILPGAGTAAGATLGARASWGVASFVLEASGMALEGMQELGIDWKNPKVFAAAWTNESIRSKIQKKMVQKGTPIAVADMLTGMMAGKVMAVANHTGNAMFKGGKLLNKSQFNKTAGSVPRFTTFQKTRNAGAELGFDSMMGMSGEYLGQWASKEPGEDWDWDAIAAEGIVGVGPGVISSALEMRGPQANYFSNAPIEITGEQMTETGSMGTVTRAGYSAPYQTFNDAESMMGHFGTYSGVTEESLAFTQEWVSRMYAVNPEGMSKLKIALSPRTPDANLENRGTFEAREGQEIMYINEQEFAADPMGTVMHESGHFARISIFPKDEDLMNAWNVLSPDDKLEAYSQYFTKKPEVSFESLDDKTKKKIQRSFNRTPDDVLAEEWFSYQWGRVLMGLTADKSVKAPIKNFQKKVVHPILSQYLGTENLGGEKNEQGYILDQKILSFLEGNGMPTPKNTEKSGNPSNATPQTKDQAQTKLNAMPGTPQEKSNIARALNAMLGAQVLTESPSFYTNLNRQAVIGASKDVEDREKKKAKEDAIAKRKKTDGYAAKDQPQDISSPEELSEQQLREDGGFQPKAKPKPQQEEADKGDTANTRVENRIKEIKDTIAELKTPNKVWDSSEKTGPRWVEQPRFKNAEDQKKAIAPLENELKGLEARSKNIKEVPVSKGGKQLPEGLGTIPREPQKSDGLFPTKPNARAAQQRIKKAAQKEAQKAELIKKREAIKKAKRDKAIEKSEFLKKQKAAAAKRKELTAFREPKDPIEVRKNRAYDEDVKIKPGKEVSLSKNRYPGKSALVKNKEDAKLPPISTTREQEEMLRLDKMLPKTVEEKEAILELHKLLKKNKETLKTIDSVDEAIDDAIKEIGPQASITEIIVKVLKLEEMLKLSPVSIVSEIERAMNPTASRSKLPSSNDIEDMATEARERIEDTKERLNLRIAEIDREIISLEKGLLPESPNQGIKAEIAELKSAKKLAKAFLNFVSPEEASVDWKDVPHNLLWYRVRTGGKLGEAKRLTFGMMAEYKSFADRNIEISTSKKNADNNIFRNAPNRTPQEELWDYATSEFDPTKGRQDDMDTPKEFYGGLSKNEYILILEAIKASAMLPKQQDIATKPMGTARWTGTGTDKKEASRGYPGGGYTVLKGANYGAIIAERIRQIQATGKKTDLKIDKSDTNFEYVENGKLYPQFSLETLEPTIPEVIALIMANGRTLELLGDPSDSMKDFDRALFTIAREEMKSKLLGEKKNDDGGIPSDIENQFEYAEEDGAPYTQVEPAATLAKSLSKILSIKARLKFENEYREYIVENIQADLKNYALSENPKTKTVEGIRGGSLNTSGKTPLAALLELEEYIQGINKNGGVYIKSEAEEKADAASKGRLVPIPKSVIKSLNGLMAQLNTRKDNVVYLKKKLEGHSYKIIPGVSNPSLKAVANFKTKPESEYSFRKPLDQSSDKIPAKEDHGEFSAGKIFETFDVMTAYARGKEIYEGTFQKERTSIANSETMPARPLDETVEADLLSSTDVSAVDLANWYLRNSDPVKQMADLQMLPSSKSGETRVQLPGGLGEGLLPYVFIDFITELYKKFGIKDLDARIKEAQWEQASEPAKGAKTKIPFRWNFEKGLFRIDGKLADPKLFTDEENRLHPEVMEALTRPIVQAVLDAEGIDVYGQFNPSSENLLQRDTTKGQSFDEDNQTLDANDDSVETGSFEDPADGETSGVLKNQGAVIERKDEEGRAELRNQILEELEQNPELVERIPADLLSELITEDMGSISEIIKKEFDRTFTPGGPDRSLNSDAGKFTSKNSVLAEKVKGGNKILLTEALSAVEKDYKGKFNDLFSEASTLMSELLKASPYGRKTTFEVGKVNRNARGSYLMPTNKVVINDIDFRDSNPEALIETIMHETWHAITSPIIGYSASSSEVLKGLDLLGNNDEQTIGKVEAFINKARIKSRARKFRKNPKYKTSHENLEKIRDFIISKRDPSYESVHLDYFLSDIAEMPTMAFSNATVAEYLMSQKISKEEFDSLGLDLKWHDKGLLVDITLFDLMMDWVLRALGVARSDYKGSVLESVAKEISIITKEDQSGRTKNDIFLDEKIKYDNYSSQTVQDYRNRTLNSDAGRQVDNFLKTVNNVIFSKTKSKTLNSDIGTPVGNNLTVALKVMSLVNKGTPLSKLLQLGARWDSEDIKNIYNGFNAIKRIEKVPLDQSPNNLAKQLLDYANKRRGVRVKEKTSENTSSTNLLESIKSSSSWGTLSKLIDQSIQEKEHPREFFDYLEVEDLIEAVASEIGSSYFTVRDKLSELFIKPKTSTVSKESPILSAIEKIKAGTPAFLNKDDLQTFLENQKSKIPKQSDENINWLYQKALAESKPSSKQIDQINAYLKDRFSGISMSFEKESGGAAGRFLGSSMAIDPFKIKKASELMSSNSKVSFYDFENLGGVVRDESGVLAFVASHEMAHGYVFQDKNQSLQDYENLVNAAALLKMFRSEAVPSPDRTLNADAGKQEMPMSPLNVYRSTDADFGFEEDFRLETTVGQELKKLGIKVDKNGVPYTDNKVAIKKGFPMILYRGVKYNPKTKTTGRPAEGVFFTRDFNTAEAYANGYKMSGNYEADMKAMDSYRDELKANGEKLIVFSYLYQSPGNSMTKKAGIAPKQKELTVGTMEGQKDYSAMLEFGEYTFGSGTGERSYVLKTSQLSGKDGLLAAHEIDANSSINEEGSTPKLIPFNEIPQNGLNPRELDKFERKDTERNLRNRTLNSDATLTSDVNPNLAKANLLSRIAGDSELKKNFEEWLKDKKDSELAGSFMMSFVDQADPVKRIHKSLFNTLKEAGLDIAKGPMRSLYNKLNTHGKWHQYFGKGYDTVEQARIQFIQPIKDAMLKYGIDQTTFGKYLLARAAPSRNQHLRDKVKRLEKEAEGLTGVPKQTALTDIKEVYLNKDGTVKDSGISDQAAYNLITEYENNPKTGANFVNFLNEALDPYYNMNKESITMLRNASMIRESTQLDGVQEGLSEYDRMVGAMSRIDLADSKPDFNFAGSKVKLSDPKYSYSPMQGFEGETEAFFDAERAWEELGKGQNSSGKGWDQPKSELLRDPAFGRVKGTRGPNPDSVLANAINQFFDSAIRSHKNEVSRSFGEMFELMRAIAYPDREEPYAPNDPELRIAYGQMSKLPEEQKKKIKEEFDEIFEQDFNETQKKNTLTFSDEYVTDGNTGEFVAKRKTLNAKFKQDPLVFVYRVNGTPEFIKFKSTTKGTRMARSMKNLKYESLPSVLKWFNKITRFMAQMFTSMNPAFIIPNFFRDLGTAFIHLTEDDKKVLIKDVFQMKNLKWITSIGKAELLISQGKDPMKGRIRTEKLKGQTEDEYAQAILKRGDKIEMYAYAKRNGAKIGYVRHDTVPELIRNIKKETGKSEGATKRRLKYALSYVDAANTGVENSVRMSTFWAAIKNGYTPQESATMSRNITVDFNQKGELTQAFGSLYVFFGAAVNSTHRFMTTLNRRSPAEQAALIGGIATASFVVAMFNRMLDDDEDEAVPDYDTISSYKRDSNLIIPLPAGLPEFFNDKKDTGYFSVPLPLGYNLFWGMGQVIADVAANNWGEVRGGSGVLEGSRRLLESSMNAFNPIGGASIATIGTPTFVTPIIELWANKNFMGRQIRYGDDKFSGVEAPGHMQDPKSTPAHWNALSKGINEFFGGDDVVKGSLSGALGNQSPLMYDQDSDIKFDISGNQFKHLAYGYLGGPGQILDTAFGGLFSATQGKASIDNVGQVPIVNRFLRGTTYGSHTRDLYYSLRTTVKTAEKAVKDAKNINSRTYGLVNNQLRPMLSMSGQVRTFEAQKNKFRRLKAKVESASNLTEAQKMQRVADIEEKELNMMVKVIKKAQSLGIS